MEECNTQIVKELRLNGGLAIITKTVMENFVIYRGIIMAKNAHSITQDGATLEEVLHETECRLRDLTK